MKKILIPILLFLSFFCLHISAQKSVNYSKDSGFTSCSADNSTLDNLEVLCRVWGFVKYHHPVFAGSAINIDNELFSLLSLVANATPVRRNEILKKWIDRLGNFRIDKQFYRQMLDTLDYETSVDLTWIKNKKVLGKDLSRTLDNLHYAKRGENSYLQNKPLYGQILTFINEKNHLDGLTGWYPDCGYRLLAFFRYWNFIEYFYPYKSLTDTPWDKVLSTYLPQVINSEGIVFQNLIYKAKTELCDTHAFSLDPNLNVLTGRYAIPADTRFIEGKLIVVSSDRYTQPEIRCFKTGDEILTINGLSIDSLKHIIKANAALSNEASLQNRLRICCWHTNQDTTKVTFCREGTVQDTLIVAQTPTMDLMKKMQQLIFDMPSDYFITDSIGYVFAGSFQNKCLDNVMDRYTHTKGLVIDLREYPREPIMFMVYKLTNKFRPYMEVSRPCYLLPGYFYRKKFKEGKEDPSQNYYKGKVVVLVNENTMSQGETTVMAFQSIPGVTVIGSPTAGTNGDMRFLPLTGHFMTYLSGYGIYYPDGGQTQRVGVRIDEIVEPTIEGIKAGRDEVLERAIEIINN